VVSLLVEAVSQGVRKHFHAAMGRRNFEVDDVAAYVPYIHYVERLWADATGAAQAHPAAPAEHAAHEH